MRSRTRLPSGRDQMRPLTSLSRRCHSGEAEPVEGTVQPPPVVITQVPPTCHTPSVVRAAARTGEDCCSLMRKASSARAATGRKASTLVIGLKSANTSTSTTSGSAEASTAMGTFMGSSAVSGPITLTRESNTTWASAPKSWARMSPQRAESSGSGWATASVAHKASPNTARRGNRGMHVS